MSSIQFESQSSTPDGAISYVPFPVHPPFPSDLKPSHSHPLLFDDQTKETCDVLQYVTPA